MAEPGKSMVPKETSLRRTVLIAVSVFLIDTLAVSNLTFTMITLAVVVLWMIPKALFALRKKDVFRIRALRVAVYLIMVVASIAAFTANNYLARHRAEELIKQVYAFKEKHHRYPNKLNEMIPEFISDVPLAKYTLWFGRFSYFGISDGPRLMYYGWAPFQRRIYDFGGQKWFMLD